MGIGSSDDDGSNGNLGWLGIRGTSVYEDYGSDGEDGSTIVDVVWIKIKCWCQIWF